jgi:hypothetical protein
LNGEMRGNRWPAAADCVGTVEDLRGILLALAQPLCDRRQPWGECTAAQPFQARLAGRSLATV